MTSVATPSAGRTVSLRGPWLALGGWLERLSPFWFTVVFTAALGLPQATLAYPIAAATIGPLLGLILILFSALLSTVTMAAVAEASVRSGIVRYGSAYVSRLAAEYLGPAGSILYTPAIFLVYVAGVLAVFCAVPRTLAGLTALPAPLWGLLFFAAIVCFVARGSLSLSVSLVVGLAAITLVLLALVMALTSGHLHSSYLTHLGAVSGRLDMQNTIGVILMGFLGEALVVQCAKVVLPRDPGGRSLILGAVAGLWVVVGVMCAWTLVVTGAVDPRALVAAQATAITPLAQVAGPVVALLGSLLVVILPGLAGLRGIIGAVNMVREWLPDQDRPLALRLGRRHRLTVHLRARARLLLALSPIAAVFVMAEWLLVIGNDSYSSILAYLGVLCISISSGIIPVLLQFAVRRKGDTVPDLVPRLLGHPVVLGAVYLLDLAVYVVHGLFIWQQPLARACALVVAALVLGATLVMARRGAFSRGVVVELREDRRAGQDFSFSVVGNGQPLAADVQLEYADCDQRMHASSGALAPFPALRCVTVDLPPCGAPQVKVRVHRVTADWRSEGLAAHLELSSADASTACDLPPSSGSCLLPLGAGAHRLRIRLCA